MEGVSPSPERLWQDALAALEKAVGRLAYETIFRCIRPLALDGDELVLAVNNQFAKEWLQTLYLPTVTHYVNEAAGKPIAIRVTISDSPTAPGRQPRPEGAARPGGVLLDDNFGSAPLNPKYTFDTFVEGNSNRFARTLALHVARGEGAGVNATPLFIWGSVGLGKTHLLQAIALYVLAHHPHRRVVYVQAETFVNQNLRAIRDGKITEFRAAYRDVDVWLVDDVQFIMAKTGATRSEEEFFHSFNTLYEADKHIVITSDQPPRALGIVDERLPSRFESGAIARIEPPDVTERIAILQMKASLGNAEVPMDVLKRIANITSNIRTLEGALTSLLAHASMRGEPVTLDLAREVLRDYPSGEDQHQATIEHIARLVCERFRISRKDLSGTKRSRAIAFPRQVAMYVARQLTTCSLIEIGKAFGGRDHSTVGHACSKIARLMTSDDATIGLVNELMSEAQLPSSANLPRAARDG